MKQGQCYVIGQSADPMLIQVSQKKTFHPDPKKSTTVAETSSKKVDVSEWLQKLNKQLSAPTPKPEAVKSMQAPPINYEKQLKQLQDENTQLRKHCILLKDTINSIKQTAQLLTASFNGAAISKAIADINRLPAPAGDASLNNDTTIKGPAEIKQSIKKSLPAVSGNGVLGKCPLSILQFLSCYPGRSFSNAQIGVATGYSPSSGGFNNSLSELNTKNLIIRNNGRIKANEEVDLQPYTGDISQMEYDIHTFKSKLSKCEGEIYQVLLDNPQQAMTKEEISQRTETSYSPTSGGFNNSVSRLNTLELIKRENGMIRLNPELLEI